MTADPTADAVHEARRDIHESLYALPAWDADKARDQLDLLERAVEARVRELVAREIEDGIPTWEGMGERASDRNRMMRIAARITRAGQPPKE